MSTRPASSSSSSWVVNTPPAPPPRSRTGVLRSLSPSVITDLALNSTTGHPPR